LGFGILNSLQHLFGQSLWHLIEGGALFHGLALLGTGCRRVRAVRVEVLVRLLRLQGSIVELAVTLVYSWFGRAVDGRVFKNIRVVLLQG